MNPQPKEGNSTAGGHYPSDIAKGLSGLKPKPLVFGVHSHTTNNQSVQIHRLDAFYII